MTIFVYKGYINEWTSYSPTCVCVSPRNGVQWPIQDMVGKAGQAKRIWMNWNKIYSASKDM